MSIFSTESEFRSLAQTLTEVIWIKRLLTELHVSLPHPLVILCSIVTTGYLARNPILHSQVKHVKISFFFTREKVMFGEVTVYYMPSQEQVDIITKPLSLANFEELNIKLSVLPRT